MNVTITIDDQQLRTLQDALKIDVEEWCCLAGPTGGPNTTAKQKEYAMRIHTARHALGMSTQPTAFVIGYKEEPPEFFTMS